MLQSLPGGIIGAAKEEGQGRKVQYSRHLPLREGLGPDACRLDGAWTRENDVARGIVNLHQNSSLQLFAAADQLEPIPNPFPTNHNAR